MIRRALLDEILGLVDTFPAVFLVGPRRSGKTALALEVAARRRAHYLDLGDEANRARLSDPVDYLRLHEDELVVLDEIHRVPRLFHALRGVIDRGRREGRGVGRFLIVGSADPWRLKQEGESLAGRIANVDLFPFHLLEVAGSDPAGVLDRLWARGGFPASFLAASDSLSHEWRRDFIRTVLERDVFQFGPRVDPETLRRFWTMLAHLQGGLLNASALSRELGVSGKTVESYLGLMVDLLLVRLLHPWRPLLGPRSGKRLVKSPKVYVRDSGLMHALLRIEDLEALMGHPKLADSWEGFVIENILAVLPWGVGAHFYRTSAGAEIDLVLEFGDQRWAIDVVRGLPSWSGRGFRLACGDIAATRRFLVHAGPEADSLGDGIEVLPLPDMMARLSDQLREEC